MSAWCRACEDQGYRYDHGLDVDVACSDCPECSLCGVGLAEHQGVEGPDCIVHLDGKAIALDCWHAMTVMESGEAWRRLQAAMAEEAEERSNLWRGIGSAAIAMSPVFVLLAFVYGWL